MSFEKCLMSVTATTVEDRDELRDFMAANKSEDEAAVIQMYMSDLDRDMGDLRTGLTAKGFDATFTPTVEKSPEPVKPISKPLETPAAPTPIGKEDPKVAAPVAEKPAVLPEPVTSLAPGEKVSAVPKPPKPKNKPRAKAEAVAGMPLIITQTKKKYLNTQAKTAGLKKDSPGYADAYAKLSDKYEDDMDRAQAALTFEQYNELNSDNPESVNRSAYDFLQEEFRAPAAEVAAVKPSRKVAPKPKPGTKALADIEIMEDRTAPDGTVVSISQPADVKLTDIDTRMDNVKLLQKCLANG